MCSERRGLLLSQSTLRARHPSLTAMLITGKRVNYIATAT